LQSDETKKKPNKGKENQYNKERRRRKKRKTKEKQQITPSPFIALHLNTFIQLII